MEGGDFEGCGIVCGGQGMPCPYGSLLFGLDSFAYFVLLFLSLVTSHSSLTYYAFTFIFLLCFAAKLQSFAC